MIDGDGLQPPAVMSSAYLISKLPRYRVCAQDALREVREAWRRYLAALEHARALDWVAPGEPVGGRDDGRWTAELLQLAREHAARLVEVRMETLRRRLRSLSEYREVIRLAENERARSLPIELRAAA